MFGLNLKYENLDDSGDEDPFMRAKMATCKWTADLLERHYPGHPWLVNVKMNRWGGVIQIQLRGVMPADFWYVVKLSDAVSDPGGRTTVLKGAGELLERFQIPRAGFSGDHWQQALQRSFNNGKGDRDALR
jgi:hypothetical protein